jgi:hypothetical protein
LAIVLGYLIVPLTHPGMPPLLVLAVLPLAAPFRVTTAGPRPSELGPGAHDLLDPPAMDALGVRAAPGG